MKLNLTSKQVFQICAAYSVAQGLIMAQIVLQLGKGHEEVLGQAKFLADIVNRNAEHLEEFDIIALREMGMIV